MAIKVREEKQSNISPYAKSEEDEGKDSEALTG